VPSCLLALACAVGLATASSNGIDGFSGNPATNGGVICNVCHSGGVAPIVTLTGPTTVDAGSTQTYTLQILGGQNVAGGLDVSATDGVLTVREPGTQLVGAELTHTTPRGALSCGIFSCVTWTFNWTAPLTPGTSTIYGAGNSVDLVTGTGGDAASNDVLTINVSGQTRGPGEVSGPAGDPLLVTGFDALTGDLTITYGAACETTDNSIYFGPLDQVASVGWSNEQCNIGNTGSFDLFAPGPDSYFFVVVGNKGVDEGSYGQDLALDGSQTERPPFAANLCGKVQNLANTCVP